MKIKEKQLNKEEKENWLYPKRYPCDICRSNMERVEGNNFYKYSYKCLNKKCHRNKNALFGAMRSVIDDVFEKGTSKCHPDYHCVDSIIDNEKCVLVAQRYVKRMVKDGKVSFEYSGDKMKN